LQKCRKCINGSGKHNNWSLSDSDGNNLLDPGNTPHDNAQFLVFLVAVIRAVNRYAEILRVAVCGAGNDHRLGANEAPPAIMSICLGSQLTDIINQIEKGKPKSSKKNGILKVGVSTLPELPKDATDRNRTSPFAFTGNKFEFRAVGSSQTVASANIAINTIIAESLDYFATELEKAAKTPETFLEKVQQLLQTELKANNRIIYNGDNYTEDWEIEAKKRGLPNLASTVDALPAFLKKPSKDLFTKYGIFSKKEINARCRILQEIYNKTIRIEAETSAHLAQNLILPASIQYQKELAESIQATRTVIPNAKQTGHTALLSRISELNSDLTVAIDKLEEETKKCDLAADAFAEGKLWKTRIIPAQEHVRSCVDQLEEIVDDRLWPLPKYREMLFLY